MFGFFERNSNNDIISVVVIQLKNFRVILDSNRISHLRRVLDDDYKYGSKCIEANNRDLLESPLKSTKLELEKWRFRSFVCPSSEIFYLNFDINYMTKFVQFARNIISPPPRCSFSFLLSSMFRVARNRALSRISFFLSSCPSGRAVRFPSSRVQRESLPLKIARRIFRQRSGGEI